MTGSKTTAMLSRLSDLSFQALYERLKENGAKSISLCAKGASLAKRARLSAWVAIFEIKKCFAADGPCDIPRCEKEFNRAYSHKLDDVTRGELLLSLADAHSRSWSHASCAAAIRRLEEASSLLRLLPLQRWHLWHRRGHCLDKLWRHAEAEAAYREALKHVDENQVRSVTLSNLGVSRFEQGHFDEAESLFSQALEIGGDEYSSLPYNNMGFLMHVTHRYDKVERYLAQALKMEKSRAHALYNMGLLRFTQWRKEPRHQLLDEARGFFEEAYAAFASEGTPHEAISSYYMQKMTSSLLNPKLEDFSDLSDSDRDLAGASRLLLTELLGDINNFIGSSVYQLSQYHDYLNQPRTIGDPGRTNHLAVLRRWNSYTPSVPIPERGRGGGYFLTWRRKGIVIDPGFDFLANFFQEGYSLRDIDAVIITHAHIDHDDDFLPLLTLLYELNQQGARDGEKRQVDLLMNVGEAVKAVGWVTKLGDLVRSVLTLSPNTSLALRDVGLDLSVDVIPTEHPEIITERYAVGLVFHLLDNSGAERLRVGYTSDAKWKPELAKAFEDCELMLMHVGTVSFRELALLARFEWSGDLVNHMLRNEPLLTDDMVSGLGFQDASQIERLLHKKEAYGQDDAREKHHLGFMGIYHLACQVNPRLVVISEFGEELGSFRHKISRALTQSFGRLKKSKKLSRAPRFLTGDIGTRIRLSDLSVKCDICGEYSRKALGEKCLRMEHKKIYHYCPNHSRKRLLGVLRWE